MWKDCSTCIISVLSSSYCINKSHSVAAEKLSDFTVMTHQCVDEKYIKIDPLIFPHVTERSCEQSRSCKTISQQCNRRCTETGSNGLIKSADRKGYKEGEKYTQILNQYSYRQYLTGIYSPHVVEKQHCGLIKPDVYYQLI